MLQTIKRWWFWRSRRHRGCERNNLCVDQRVLALRERAQAAGEFC